MHGARQKARACKYIASGKYRVAIFLVTRVLRVDSAPTCILLFAPLNTIINIERIVFEWPVTRDRSIDRSILLQSGEARIIIGISGLCCSCHAIETEARRGYVPGNVRGDLSRSIFTNTHTHGMCSGAHDALSLSLSTSSYVRSDIQIAAERAKPALNGTGSNDDVVRSSKIVHGDQNLYLWPVPTDTFRFKDDTCTLREIVSRCICGWNASNWPIAKAGH